LGLCVGHELKCWHLQRGLHHQLFQLKYVSYALSTAHPEALELPVFALAQKAYDSLLTNERPALKALLSPLVLEGT
jgi:hypothetical protein